MDGLVHTSRSQRAARLSRRISGAAFSWCRWRSGGAGCWRSIGWRTPRSSRIWPNRLVVAIKERKPVAFVNLPFREAGLARAADRRRWRAARAARARALRLSGAERSHRRADGSRAPPAGCRPCCGCWTTSGPLAKDVSEVNAATPENLVIVAQVEGRAIELVMGNQNFCRAHAELSCDHYPEIHRRSPQRDGHSTCAWTTASPPRSSTSHERQSDFPP